MKNQGLVGESLLRLIAEKFEIKLLDLYALMPPSSGSPLDFYPLALLHHAGFIELSVEHENKAGVKRDGIVGSTVYESAGLLADWCCAKVKQPFHLEVKVYLTAKGLLKLEELAQREESRQSKRADYLVTALIAAGAACLTGAIRITLG